MNCSYILFNLIVYRSFCLIFGDGTDGDLVVEMVAQIH